jgi:hypothetical protein
VSESADRVRPVTYRTWTVASSQPGHEYTVVYDPIRGRFMCSCQGYVVHRTKCKHIQLVLNYIRERGGL